MQIFLKFIICRKKILCPPLCVRLVQNPLASFQMLWPAGDEVIWDAVSRDYNTRIGPSDGALVMGPLTHAVHSNSYYTAGFNLPPPPGTRLISRPAP